MKFNCGLECCKEVNCTASRYNEKCCNFKSKPYVIASLKNLYIIKDLKDCKK